VQGDGGGARGGRGDTYQVQLHAVEGAIRMAIRMTIRMTTRMYIGYIALRLTYRPIDKPQRAFWEIPNAIVLC
jgi:hypothetical protein